MQFKDYYDVMGVARGATQDEIKRAYRKLARKFHPDVSKEKNAEERFKELQEAYEVLKDPEKRAAYDQLGANWQQGQDFRPPPDWGKGFEFTRGQGPAERRAAAGPDFSDFFSELFGARSPFGGARRFRPARRRGRSRLRGGRARITSPASRSTSRTPTAAARARSSYAHPRSRRTATSRSKPRTLRVSIPAGVVEGQQIRLAGQGNPGIGGGPAGDLFLEINAPAAPAVQARRP